MKLCRIHLNTVAAVPEEYLISLMPQRYARSRRYLRHEDQLRCLGAGLLINRVMGFEEHELRSGQFGKPYVPGRTEFSLSHGGNWVILAENRTPLGVDIEPICSTNLDIARRVFTSNELVWMEQDPLVRFHILWTLKESIMKGTGLGMQLDPALFDVIPVRAPKQIAGHTWHTFWTLHDGCAVACASTSKIDTIEWTEIFF